MKDLKKIILLFTVLVFFVQGKSFAQGIEFEHISLEEALEKAKAEDKMVFIDFYTVWCAPCKGMTKGVFPNEKVGTVYNRDFINVKLDAEKEGREAARKYNVHVYPTLMFLNGDGEMVYKATGAKGISGTLQMATDAVNALSSGYSLSDLKKQYESGNNDERFLKMYIEKMIGYKEYPVAAIDDWLKIQTEIKEDDVDMMEYLMEHFKYLIVGGKGEAILYANFDEYMDIATKAEETKLENLKYAIVKNTREQAYMQKSPELMRLYIDTWKKYPDDKKNVSDLKDYEMDYLLLAKEYDEYRKVATVYLDSVMNAKSLEQIRLDDAAYYKEYKETRYRPSLMGNAKLKELEKGREALEQTNIINRVARYYLRYCAEKKSDYKQLYKWIDYGSELIPDDYKMDELRSDALKKQGKIEEAIEYKEIALNKIPENSRVRSRVEKELEDLKK
ncbi:thioredoxin domain-containing protein [Draconibacterium sp. IB214405]|uniref:thioredoxin family protein n=1 Tax=Draconibacterium sp. IB214405 TaxID=3097352 RepID=UPI002A13540C|nr:thioredoxin domain-containing protein [Draconibacterium sp. IB214405]MDX8340286.1 thioredoxin domain-containing protein [Draconibacterium sp. IB214405]